jgi:hypothetical protein
MVSGRVLRRLVAVGVVALAVAAACSSSAAASAQDVVLGTAQRTLTERTAQVAVVVGFDGPVTAVVGAASGQSFDGTGAIDFRARRSQVSLNLPSNLAGGGLLQAVVDNNALLLNLPGLAQSLPGLKPWTQSNPTDPSQQQALGVLNQLLLVLDPVTAIEALYGAGAHTTKVGTETIRGTATTHYRTTVDLKAAAGKLSGAARAEYERAVSALGQTSVPFDVWVDAQRRARRIQVGINLPNAGGKITATLELFDYGSPVTITIPPPDQIASAMQLATVDPCVVGHWHNEGGFHDSFLYTNTGETVDISGGAGTTTVIQADGTWVNDYSNAASFSGTLANGQPLVVMFHGTERGKQSNRNGTEHDSNNDKSNKSLSGTVGGGPLTSTFIGAPNADFTGPYTCDATHYTVGTTTWTRG